MHGGARTGSITCSARTVGVGTGTRANVAPQTSPHMFPQHRVGPCTRYRSAESSPVARARRAIAACNVARYSES